MPWQTRNWSSRWKGDLARRLQIVQHQLKYSASQICCHSGMVDIGTLANDKLSKIESCYIYTIKINRCKDFSVQIRVCRFYRVYTNQTKIQFGSHKKSVKSFWNEEFDIQLRAKTSIQVKHRNTWTNLQFVGTLTDIFGQCTAYLRSFWKLFQFGYPPFQFRQPPYFLDMPTLHY